MAIQQPALPRASRGQLLAMAAALGTACAAPATHPEPVAASTPVAPTTSAAPESVPSAVPSAVASAAPAESSAAPVATASVAPPAASTASPPAKNGPEPSGPLVSIGVAAYGGPPPTWQEGPSVTGPKPKVQIDVDGDAADKSVVMKARARFRMCAQKAANIDPTTEGTLKVKVGVATDGKAKVASMIPNGNVSAEFVKCATAAANAMKFAERAQASELTLRVLVISEK